MLILSRLDFYKFFTTISNRSKTIKQRIMDFVFKYQVFCRLRPADCDDNDKCAKAEDDYTVTIYPPESWQPSRQLQQPKEVSHFVYRLLISFSIFGTTMNIYWKFHNFSHAIRSLASLPTGVSRRMCLIVWLFSWLKIPSRERMHFCSRMVCVCSFFDWSFQLNTVV